MITAETLLAWAKTTDNPQATLAELLTKMQVDYYGNLGLPDLRDVLQDLLSLGHKGHNNYTIDELLEEILEIVGEEASEITLEEFLEAWLN